MNKAELIANILSYENKIGIWKIFINEFTNTDFAMGYGYDDNTNLWMVYQNADRGMVTEWKFENEEQAAEKLYKKVKFQHKILSKQVEV